MLSTKVAQSRALHHCAEPPVRHSTIVQHGVRSKHDQRCTRSGNGSERVLPVRAQTCITVVFRCWFGQSSGRTDGLSACRQVYFTTAVLSSLKPIRSALLRALTADGATASSARSSSCGRHGMPIRLLDAFQANRRIKRKAHAPRSARRCRLVRARRSLRCLLPRARTPEEHGTAAAGL